MNQKAIIITAPSGAGKTTLVSLLLKKHHQFAFSISACTRKKRNYEIDGKDYYFLSPEEFKAKIENDAFLEWEEVYENMYYGTLKSEVERLWKEEKVVIFDIDVKGAVNLKQKLGDKAISIFIMTPSKETLKERLAKRATETEEMLQKRLNKSLEELEYKSKMDTFIINNQLEDAFEELETKVFEFLNK